MENLTGTARPEVLALGQEIQAIQQNEATSSGLESLRPAIEGQESVADLYQLGATYFQRINGAAYGVLCGSSDGSADWKAVAGQGERAVTGAIATLLAAHLAIASPVAGALAAVIVKMFYDATSKELCTAWKAHVS